MQTIAIIGAGFGGLSAAFRLSRSLARHKLNDRYAVVLIDRNAYHTFTPLLYEIACTSRTSADDATLRSLASFPLTALLAGTGVEFVQDEVRRVNFVDKSVECKSRSLSFDYLVIALGSEVNYFDIPGLKEGSLPLKTADDALSLRNTIAYLVAEHRDRMLHIVVGGGGATGVEIAGEIKMWACELTAEASAKTAVHVSIVDAGASVLTPFDPRVRTKAMKRLNTLGVGMLMRERVKRVSASHILLESGEKLHHDLLIWTGGVRPNSVAESLAAEKEPRGRLRTSQDLSCVFENPNISASERVYAVGDIVCLEDPDTGAQVPGAARPAILEGRVAADCILSSIMREEHMPKPHAAPAYRHRTYPYVIPVGGRYAVVKLGPFVIGGFPGWIVKNLVELNYFRSIMPWRKALAVWFKGFRIFMKNDRLG